MLSDLRFCQFPLLLGSSKRLTAASSINSSLILSCCGRLPACLPMGVASGCCARATTNSAHSRRLLECLLADRAPAGDALACLHVFSVAGVWHRACLLEPCLCCATALCRANGAVLLCVLG